MIKPYIGLLILWFVSTLMLSAAEISGVVKDKNGRPVTQGYVFVTPAGSSRIISWVDIGSHGEYRLSVPEEGGLDVVVGGRWESARAAVRISGQDDKIVLDFIGDQPVAKRVVLSPQQQMLEDKNRTLALLLFEAVRSADASAVKQLIASGANVNSVALEEAPYTALHLAVATGSLPVIQAVIAAGADLDAPTKTGLTALHIAAAKRNPDAVEALLTAGAHKMVFDSEKKTPRDIAVAIKLERLIAVFDRY